jgi:drug/metabolite transporter (DMT)-like permease
MVNKSNQIKGIYFAIATAFISGISIFFNKFAVGLIKPPLVFTTFKNVGVGLLIIGIIIALGKWKQIKKISKKDFYYLLAIGVIGGSLPFYLFFTGLSQIPAINAALIQKTLVFWVILLAIPFLKEKLSKLQFLAVILLFLGNLTTGGFKGFLFSQGELMILAATILWAVENVLAKKVLPNVDSDIVVAARMGFGSVILLISSFILAPKEVLGTFHLSNMQSFLLIGSILLLLGYVMTWYRALKFAPAITVASILVASTLVTNVLSAVFITHAWTKDMGIQSLIMLIGVGLFIFATRKGSSSVSALKKAKRLG